jgi:uncharacterized membrane protein
MTRLSAREQALEQELHVSIYIVIYKFLLGVVELLTGLALLFFGPNIYRVIQASLLMELSEDPHDLLARLGQALAPDLLTRNNYIILSLLLLGVAKMSGAVGLVYKQNWGVDLLVGLTLIMAPFQIVSLVFHPHIFDLLYFVVGLLIALYLIEFKPGGWISRVLGVKQGVCAS